MDTDRPRQSCVLLPHVECSNSQGRPSQGFPGLWQTAPRLRSRCQSLCVLCELGQSLGLRVGTRVTDVSCAIMHGSERLQAGERWLSHCVKPAMNFVCPGMASGSTIAVIDTISSTSDGFADDISDLRKGKLPCPYYRH